MKKYKLLKDLPFAKAGEEFQLHRGGISDYITLYRNEEQIYQFKVGEDVSEMFDEWFKEVKELERYYFIGGLGYIGSDTVDGLTEKYRQELCNYFETQEEAEKYLEYLKAKAIIKQDTKGFKPNWKNPSQKRFFGYYNLIDKKLCYFNAGENMESKIYFKSEEDIEESFKKHPEEWKTYIDYER